MWVSKKRLVRPMGTFAPISGRTGIVEPYSGALPWGTSSLPGHQLPQETSTIR